MTEGDPTVAVSPSPCPHCGASVTLRKSFDGWRVPAACGACGLVFTGDEKHRIARAQMLATESPEERAHRMRPRYQGD